MIFVTLGSQKYKFNRLIKYLKNLDPTTFFVQCGNTKCPDDFNSKDYLSKQEFENYIANSDFIISHAGISIIEALEKGKKVLCVPRKKEYKENINTHQIDFCKYLEEERYILAAYTEEDFVNKIKTIKKVKLKKYQNNTKEFYNNLNAIIDSYLK